MKTVTLLLLLILFSACYQVERNCDEFKSGDFYSEVEINDVLYTSYFKRNKTLQIETYEGRTDSSNVRWINNCEMVFKTINPKNMAEKKDIHLKILVTTDTSYTFEYSYVGESNKQRGIAYKLR
jgi:hypothetical protein